MKGTIGVAALAAALVSTFAWSAGAQESKERIVTTEVVGPSPPMVIAGFVTFGIGYGSAVGVASTSSRDSDRNLIVPLVGPWVSLAARDRCVARSCTSETTAKVLIAGDGVIQAVGIVSILSAFAMPERRIITTVAISPHLRVEPAPVGSGYGVTAMGRY